MERRDFMKLALGIAAGAAALGVAAVQAAPLAPQPLVGDGPQRPPDGAARNAIATQDDIENAQPDKVQWRFRRRYRRRRFRVYRRVYRRRYRRRFFF